MTRRNIAHVEPAEREMLRDAIKALNQHHYPGSREDTPAGGVSWWFKQDEIHRATHAHNGPEFLPWLREFTNRFEQLIRQINPQLSLHYWDFKDDPRCIQKGNVGGGEIGPVNLFDSNFMGSPGIQQSDNPIGGEIGEPWLSAAFYDPLAGTPGHPPDRDVTSNPADPPKYVMRPSNYPGETPSPALTASQENHILSLQNFGPGIAQNMDTDVSYVKNIKPLYFRTAMEEEHTLLHIYYAAVSSQVAFRDPFVFLLHTNLDRIYAMWQTDPEHPERLDPNTVYGAESDIDVEVVSNGMRSIHNLSHLVEPWSTGHGHHSDVRAWEPTHENQGRPHNYHDFTLVTPPRYDTLPNSR